MGFAHRDCRFHRKAKSHSASRGGAVVRRPSGRPGVAGDRRRASGRCSTPCEPIPRASWARRFAAASATALPFLVKVLAADEPLSLQAHPSAEQAVEGFAREDKLGIPVSAPTRNYRDRSHKPELLVALGQFEALAGFRPAASSVELMRALAVIRPRPVRQPAVRPVRRRRPAGAVHHVDHRAAARPRRAGARGDRRRHPLCPVGQEGVRGRGQDRARTRRALPRRRGCAGLAAAEPDQPQARGRHLPARGQPAHLPARRRRRGDGQLRQRAARRADPQTRRRAGIAAGARLHAGRRAMSSIPESPGTEPNSCTPHRRRSSRCRCCASTASISATRSTLRRATTGRRSCCAPRVRAVVHAKSSSGDAGAWSGRVGGRRRRADPAGRADVRRSCSAPPWGSREGPSLSTEGSTRAILAALLANAGIAVAKFIGFLITGSSSMLAEAVHSVADTSATRACCCSASARPAKRPTAAPVRVRPQPLLLLVRRGAGAVHTRLGVRALRGLPQDQPPRGADVTQSWRSRSWWWQLAWRRYSFRTASWSRDR